MTLQQLCDRMESEPGEPLISFSQLARIERGDQPYSQPILEAIAEQLQVKTSQLLEDDPSKDGEVVDLMRKLDQVDSDKKKTILSMLRAAIAS